MQLRVAGGILCLGVASLCVTAAELPRHGSGQGWCFLPTDYVDTQISAFHDPVSGAFIAVERGFTSMLDETAPRIAAEHHAELVRDKTGTWAYAYVIVPVESKGTDDVPSCDGERREHRRIEATFTSDSAPYILWNFTALTCSAIERSRAIEFLFEEPDRWSVLMDAKQMNVKVLRERDIVGLTRGDRLERLEATLGLASDVARQGSGFELSFILAGIREPTLARLRFDRAGHLMDRKIEKATQP